MRGTERRNKSTLRNWDKYWTKKWEEEKKAQERETYFKKIYR